LLSRPASHAAAGKRSDISGFEMTPVSRSRREWISRKATEKTADIQSLD
jgi:hypothetical protein